MAVRPGRRGLRITQKVSWWGECICCSFLFCCWLVDWFPCFWSKGWCGCESSCTSLLTFAVRLRRYRYYDAVGQEPAYPFGFGLSYTSFDYSSLAISGSISADTNASVTFDVLNTGARAGSAVPQLYLAFPASAGEPPQVLRGFAKVRLNPGEKQTISLPLSQADVSIWDVATHQWAAVSGEFTVVLSEHSRAPVATLLLNVQ